MEFHQLIGMLDLASPYGEPNPPNKLKLTLLQNEMLTFVNEHRFTVIYKGRQEGVSTAMNIYLLWLLLNNPGYTIGVIFVNAQEREMFRQMLNMNLTLIQNFFKEQGIDEPLSPINHNTSRTILQNNSSIHYWTKNSPNIGRGIRFNLLYISELIVYDNSLDMLMPTISARGSKLIVTSTDMRNLKENFLMNGDGVEEYWCADKFYGERFVIVEKLERMDFKFKFFR